MTAAPDGGIALRSLRRCFDGAVPAVVATVSADGVPNVTYLSCVHLVDDEHVALSNQFFSKTSRNLAENPHASVLVIDSATYDEYRLTLRYLRTERRGALFDRLRDNVDAIAAMTGMSSVFRLRAADVCRVEHVERLHARATPHQATPEARPTTAGVAALSARIARCADLDAVIGTTVDGLHALLGYEHSLLLLLDEEGTRLYTIASHGYPDEGIGSEVQVGVGIVGLAATRAAPVQVGSLRAMGKYSRRVRRSFEGHAGIGPGHELPVPGLPGVDSRLAVPAIVRGEVVGVLVVESTRTAAFDEADEAALTIVASLVASAVELERAQAAERPDDERPGVPGPRGSGGQAPASAATRVRFYAVDGSTFFDGAYLIKGVAGRILWSLLGAYDCEGRTEFTNKEVRLDASLELPEYRDNFENRLILLKRRLDERAAPVRIEKTGRGRFRLLVSGALTLEAIAPSDR